MKSLLILFFTLFSFLAIAQDLTEVQKQQLDVNYLINGGFENGKSGWSTYNDGASATPVDGVGGTANITLTTTTTLPHDGKVSGVLTKDAVNRQGQGIKRDFSIPDIAKGKVVRLKFSYEITSGTYSNEDSALWIYDVTNSRLIQPSAYTIEKSGLKESKSVEFQSSIDSNLYRLIIHVTSTSASAYTLKLDSFNVGLTPKVYGSTSTTPVTATYTLTNFGNATVTGTVSREGVYANFKGRITIGSTLPSGTLTLNLPSGYSLTGNDFKHGAVTAYKATATATFYTGQPYAQSATTIGFAGGSSAGIWTGNITPAVFIAGDFIEFDFRAQIQGWSSSQIMSSDADTRVVSTKVYNSSTFVTGSGTVIPFNTAVEDTNGAWDAVNYRYNVKTPGTYILRIKGQSNAITFGAAGLSHTIYYRVNGTPTDIIWNYTSGSALTVAPFIASSTKAVLKAGDYIDLAYYNNSIAVTLPAAVYFEIERISGPSQIAASESVSALYTGAPPTGTINNSVNTVTFGTKVKDSHNAYSGGTYTVPVSGTYSISAATYQAATYVAGNQTITYIVIDGVSKYFNSKFIEASTSLVQTQVTALSIPLLAGQLVTIGTLNNATTPTFQPSASGNYFSITRTGNY